MQILQFPDSSWDLTVLKNIFLRFIGLKGLKMVWKKSSLIWNFFPWFWLKTHFSLISLTGKSLQIFPWIPWFPWSVGTLQTPSWADTPTGQTPARQTSPPGQTPPRAYTTPQQTATAADGMHPTGMHSCLISCFFRSIWQKYKVSASQPLNSFHTLASYPMGNPGYTPCCELKIQHSNSKPCTHLIHRISQIPNQNDWNDTLMYVHWSHAGNHRLCSHAPNLRGGLKTIGLYTFGLNQYILPPRVIVLIVII